MVLIWIGLMLLTSSAQAVMYYVVNGLDESLGWVNTANMQSDDRAVTLGNIPSDIAVYLDRIYVVNSGYNTLQVIDREQLQTLDEIELTGAVNPYGCAVFNDHFVAVTGLLSGTVTIVDAMVGNVDTTFVTGVAPQAVGARDEMLYVLNTGVAFPQFGNGVLKRYDTQDYSLVDSLVVGVNAQAMEFIEGELHVLCTGNYDDIAGSVHVVELATMRVDTILQLGGSPGALSAWGYQVYVAAGGWAGDGFVYQYRSDTREVLRDVNSPILCGGGASDIVASPAGGFAVTCFQDNTLQVCNASGDQCQTYAMSSGPGALGALFWLSDAIEAPRAELPQSLQMITAFPNPFNGTVTLQWERPFRAASGLKFFDVLGREAGSLDVPPGAQTATWSPGERGGTEVSAGIYFGRWELGQNSPIVKIVYLK